MSNILRLSGVKKHYQLRRGLLGQSSALLRAVDGVSLDLIKGETLGLVGESGCGKSTLARLILALEKPTKGKIEFHGQSVSSLDRAGFSRKVQLIFQDPYSSLNPRQSIGSIVRESLDIHKIGTRKERKAKVMETLSLVGLAPEHASRYPHEFSGGQRQRVAIARTLVMNPELIICDEPVSALDVSIRAQVLNLLSELQNHFGLTYLFISHDLSVVGHVADRVAVMYLGKIVELSLVADLFKQPAHPYTRALLSAVPEPDPEAQPERIPLTGDLPSPLNPPSGCAFHPRCPEAMDICAQRFPDTTALSPGHSTACWLYSDNENKRI